MKATIYLLVDADKSFWVDTEESKVVQQFNENGSGVLPARIIKIIVDCTTPAIQELLVSVPDQGDEVTVESIDARDA